METTISLNQHSLANNEPASLDTTQADNDETSKKSTTSKKSKSEKVHRSPIALRSRNSTTTSGNGRRGRPSSKSKEESTTSKKATTTDKSAGGEIQKGDTTLKKKRKRRSSLRNFVTYVRKVHLSERKANEKLKHYKFSKKAVLTLDGLADQKVKQLAAELDTIAKIRKVRTMNKKMVIGAVRKVFEPSQTPILQFVATALSNYDKIHPPAPPRVKKPKEASKDKKSESTNPKQAVKSEKAHKKPAKITAPPKNKKIPFEAATTEEETQPMSD